MNLKNTKKWVKKHRFATMVIIAVIAVVGVFSYNKYLDWRNVEDMKALLADFEKLEKAIESETGNQFYIEADCDTGGEKFSTTYSCSIDLLPLSGSVDAAYENASRTYASEKLNSFNNCGLIKDLGFAGAEKGNFYTCSISVRGSNKDRADSTFSRY